MKKTYLVKKNPELPASDDNWIIMNGYEFAMFMKTEEGKKRKNNFGYLCPLDIEEGAIIAECGSCFANRLHRERNIYNRRRKYEEESGMETLSLDFSYRFGPDDEAVSIGETIPDESVDIEGEAILRDEKERLAFAFSQLDEAEADLIYWMYLTDEPLSASEYAEATGVPRSTVYYRNDVVLAKLKEIMNLPVKDQNARAYVVTAE